MADNESAVSGETSNGSVSGSAQTKDTAVVTAPSAEAPSVQARPNAALTASHTLPNLPSASLPTGAVVLKPEEKARMAMMHRRLVDYKVRLAQLHLDVELRKAKAARDPATHLEQLANTLFEYEQRKADLLTEIHRLAALFQDATSELAMAHGLSGERGQIVCDPARGMLLPKTPVRSAS